MSASDLLGRIVERLDRAQIPHMIAGSFASTYHGEPRTTHDIDIVIDPSQESLVQFVEDLPADEYYADIEVARDAFRARGMFNVVDLTSGWKIDFMIRKDRAFSVEEFGRRQPADLFGVRVFMATAEDTVIAKLEWSKMSESERQLRDVRAILAVSGELLDRDYIEAWVAALGLTDLWSTVQK